jgi:predicted PhzF superfamily epimerase YddE/YHI9
MPISVEKRRDLLKAERSHNDETIAAAINEAIEASAPDATFLDAEMAFRDAGAQTFLVAVNDHGTVKICHSVTDMLAELDKAGRTPAQNRKALAEIT